MANTFTIETRRIPVGKNGKNGFFEVRGVNTEDLTHLSVDYLDDMKAAVAKYGAGGLRPDDVADVVTKLAREFASFATEIISRCADAPERRDDFHRLPFNTQLKALKEIFDLTMQDGGVDVGNFWGAIAALLDANGLNLGPISTRLNAIINSAENRSAH